MWCYLEVILIQLQFFYSRAELFGGIVMLRFWNYASHTLGDVNRKYNITMDLMSSAVCYTWGFSGKIWRLLSSMISKRIHGHLFVDIRNNDILRKCKSHWIKKICVTCLWFQIWLSYDYRFLVSILLVKNTCYVG